MTLESVECPAPSNDGSEHADHLPAGSEVPGLVARDLCLDVLSPGTLLFGTHGDNIVFPTVGIGDMDFGVPGDWGMDFP